MNNRRNYSKGRRVLKSVWGDLLSRWSWSCWTYPLATSLWSPKPQHEIIRLGRAVQQALGSIACVKYLVSDRAQALVKLALEGLGCRSIPDLFHALRELNRQIGSPLATVEPVGQAVVPNPGNSY